LVEELSIKGFTMIQKMFLKNKADGGGLYMFYQINHYGRVLVLFAVAVV
jgi:hypothetical protein